MANYEHDLPFNIELRKLDAKEPNHADTAFNPHFKQLVNNDRYLHEQVLDAQTKVGNHTHIKANITDFAHTHTKDNITDFPTSLPANGGISASCTGNAATATKLQTVRTIAISGGATGTATSFDGSANITIPITALDVSKANAGTLPVGRGGTGLTTISGLLKGNGTNAFSTAVAGTDYVVPSGNITGNAATASKWQTARTLSLTGVITGSASMDGSGNVSLATTLAAGANLGFTQSLTTNGWTKLPNGLIFQWGTTTEGTASVTFPITFPSTCAFVGMYPQRSDVQMVGDICTLKTKTATAFTKGIWSGGSSTVIWFAVGY